MECREIEATDYYGRQNYVGPKCSNNGQRINLGVFTDEYCTQATDDGIFAKTYGITLPYSSSSMFNRIVEVANNILSLSLGAPEHPPRDPRGIPWPRNLLDPPRNSGGIIAETSDAQVQLILHCGSQSPHRHNGFTFLSSLAAQGE